MFVKTGSLVYSVFIVAVASRHLTSQDIAALLLSFNILIPLGLIQASIGNYVVRLVSASHVKGIALYENPDIAAAFWLLVCAASLAFLFFVPALIYLNYTFLIPVSGLILLGMACSVGDQIRFATERSWSSNIYQAAGYIICGSGYGLFLLSHAGTSLAVCALVAYGAPGIAAVISFTFLLSNRSLRVFLSRPSFQFSADFARGLIPLFGISLASVILLNIPLLGTLVKWFPKLSHDDVILMRLSTLTVATSVFVFGPVMPTMARWAESRQPTGIMVAFLLLACIGLAASSGAIFYLAARPAAFLWVHQSISGMPAVADWSIALSLWVCGAIASQYAMLRVRLSQIAKVHLAADSIIVIAAWLVSALVGSISVAESLIPGLLVYCGGSLYLTMRSLLVPREIRQAVRL